MSSHSTLEFSIVTELSARQRRVRPSGEIDLATKGRVDEALRAAERSDARVIFLDLRGVTFIDASGVHVALQADERLRRTGRRLRLIRGPALVQRVFRLTDTERRLPFVA